MRWLGPTDRLTAIRSESVNENLEARLIARATRDGLEFRVDQRPDGIWDVAFWTRVGIPPGLAPEGQMVVGAEADTREQAMADLWALLQFEDEEHGP
jgi:hypothetical protein